MLEGKCAMKSFKMRVDQRMAHSFLKACFGVTIDDTCDSRVYHSENESLEVYFTITIITRKKSQSKIHFLVNAV